jgi:hypothetical protein
MPCLICGASVAPDVLFCAPCANAPMEESMTLSSYCGCQACTSASTYKANQALSVPTLPYSCDVHSQWFADYCNSCAVGHVLTILSTSDPKWAAQNAFIPSEQYKLQGSLKLALRSMNKSGLFAGSWAEGLIETLYADWDRTSEVLPYDLMCEECGHYVSSTLPSDSDHWDQICGGCYNHSDGPNCVKCDNCGDHNLDGECSCCTDCGSPSGYCECCEYCSNAPGECECEECEDCGAMNQSYCGCGSQPYRFGTTKEVTWGKLPDVSLSSNVVDMEQVDVSIDPVRAAADFYLLDSIVNLVRYQEIEGGRDGFELQKDRLVGTDQMLPAYVIGAKRTFESLVDRLDRSFLSYAVNAVGGELRYHRACAGDWAPQSRRGSWKAFVGIVNNKGVQPLFDAVDLFEEFGGGSYGGTKWALIAKVTAKRLAGQMPAWMFVDRLFTLEHNGGCCLNKASWATSNQLGYGLHHMKKVLNAHSGKCQDGFDGCECEVCTKSITGWDLLLKVASPEVAEMWRKTDRRLSAVARRVGGVLTPPVPSKAKSTNRRTRCAWCSMYDCVC